MDLLNMLASQIGDDKVEAVSQQIGADKQQTQNAIASSLPLVVGGLSRMSENDEGKKNLLSFLDRDGDGDIMDDIGSIMSNPITMALATTLIGNILGNKKDKAENAVAKSSGLDIGSAGKILATIAPLAIGMLSKKKSEEDLDGDGIADALQTHKKEKEEKEGVLGFVGNLLDRDGDGDAVDDIGGLVGSLFGGR